MSFLRLGLMGLLLAACGCTAYSWKSAVPEALRTVAVPVFRNESSVTELGATLATQLRREFQREGTFALARVDDAAIVVQGDVKSVTTSFSGGNRKTHLRLSEHRLVMKAVVSVVDRLHQKTLINEREYLVQVPFVHKGDLLTARRDASARAAEDLARQVVDDVTGFRWKELNLEKPQEKGVAQ